jgi:phosphoglycerol transferase
MGQGEATNIDPRTNAESGTWGSNDVMRPALIYLEATVIAALALVFALRLWEADLDVPFYYSVGGDVHQHLGLFKGIADNGWYLHNPRLGAPGTLDRHDYPNVETDTFLLFKLFMLATADPSRAANLVYLLTYFLAAWSALFVLRRSGVGDQVAVVASLLFAFAPYHFWRGPAHLHLANYYPVPLFAMLALRLARGEPCLVRPADGRGVRPCPAPRVASSVLLAALLSLTSAYFAFFGLYFLAVGGLIGVLRRPRAARALDAVLMAGLVGVLFAAHLAPSLIYARVHGPNPAAYYRPIVQYHLYGLRVANMLRPTFGHRLPLLRSHTLETHGGVIEVRDGRYPDLVTLMNEVNEGYSCTPLGVVGSCGFLVLVALGLAGARRLERRRPVLADLGRLNLAALLLALAGGFSELVALYVTMNFRAYARMSIAIAFFSLFALALLADRYRRTRAGGAPFAIGLWVVAVLGLLDQSPSLVVPDYARDAAMFRSDRDFVARIERSTPPGSMIFQLPPNSFPEFGVHFQMHDFNHFRGYYHSRRLRWSYGAMRGREVERWQSSLAPLPIPQLVARLTEAGFRGIYVNRSGHARYGEAVVRDLASRLGPPPIVSADGELVFFRLPGS